MLNKIFSLIALIVSLLSLETRAMDLDSWRDKFNQAIKSNDLAKVQKLMPNDNSIDSIDQHGETPLALAAYFGHLQIMLEILKNPHCIDIDRSSATAPIKRRPLHFACSKETENKPLQLEVVQALISKKANLDEPNGYRESPLCLAVRRSNNPALVSLLVNAGATLASFKSEFGSVPSTLDAAIYEACPACVPLLLKSPRLTRATLDKAIDYCQGYIQRPPSIDISKPGKMMSDQEIEEAKKKREIILALLLAQKQHPLFTNKSLN